MRESAPDPVRWRAPTRYASATPGRPLSTAKVLSVETLAFGSVTSESARIRVVICLALEIDTDIAALAAFEEADMRVVGQHRRDRFIGRSGRRHRRADKLGRHRRRSRIVEIDPQVVGEERVDVAADHHRIRHARSGDALQEPPPARRVAVPVVGPIAELAVARFWRATAPSARPGRSRSISPWSGQGPPRASPPGQSRSCCGPPARRSGQAASVSRCPPQLVRRRIAGFARPVLAAVDHRDFQEVAEGEAVVDAHHRPVRDATGSAAPACARKRPGRRRRAAAETARGSS